MERNRIGMAGPFGGDRAWSSGAFLRQMWNGARREQTLPRREALAPRRMTPILSQVLLLERWSAGVPIIRYAGMDVTTLHGQELTDRPLSVLFEPGARPALAVALDQVLDGARTVEMAILSDQGMLRPRLGGRLTLLPVTCGVTGLISALGCLELDGPARHPPRRFRIERVLGEALFRHAVAASAGTAPKKIVAKRPRTETEHAPQSGMGQGGGRA